MYTVLLRYNVQINPSTPITTLGEIVEVEDLAELNAKARFKIVDVKILEEN